LTQLSLDFLEIASTYGKTIINEYFLPNHEKSISTAKVGGSTLAILTYVLCELGVAGGEKFIVRGIYLKLAKDHQRIYGDSNEFANKVAGNELRGAAMCFNFFRIGVCVPMQALVDYMGYRLVVL